MPEFITRTSRLRGLLDETLRGGVIVGSAGDSYVAVAMQTAEGRAETRPARFRFLKYLDGTDGEIVPATSELPRIGDDLDPGEAYDRYQVGRVHLAGNLRPEIAGQLFQLAPGSATWGGEIVDDAFRLRTSRLRAGDKFRSPASQGPVTHTFVARAPSAPYATVQVARSRQAGEPPNRVGLYSDALVTGWAVTAQGADPVAFAAEVTSYRTGASAAPLSPTYPTNDPLLFLTGASILIDGQAATGFTGFTLEYGRDVKETELADQMFPTPQGRTMRLEYRRRYEDPAFWQRVYSMGAADPTSAVATGSFDVILSHGEEHGAGLFPDPALLPSNDLFPAAGETGEQRSVRFLLPLIRYDAARLTELDPNGRTVMETVTALALRGATDALVIQVSNGHASAYA